MSRFWSGRRKFDRFHFGLKTVAIVRAVAKRLVRRPATTAEGNCFTAGKIEGISLRILNLELSRYAQWPILRNDDCDITHDQFPLRIIVAPGEILSP